MEDDPDKPGYRYPHPGERFWHERLGFWVTVTDYAEKSYPTDEVAVRAEQVPNTTIIVKLRNLTKGKTDG